MCSLDYEFDQCITNLIKVRLCGVVKYEHTFGCIDVAMRNLPYNEITCSSHHASMNALSCVLFNYRDGLQVQHGDGQPLH